MHALLERCSYSAKPVPLLQLASTSSFVMATSLVLPIAELTLNVLNGVLGEIGSVERKIATGLSNDSTYAWTSPFIYFFSGTADKGLPGEINAQYALAFGARKTAGPVATGSVGVITYYVASLNVTVALMWSVPFDYNLYSNWWNVAILSGNQRASYDLYYSLYYNRDPFRGDSNYYTRTLQWNLDSCRIHGSLRYPCHECIC